MQEPVLEPAFEEMRDVAERGEIAGIAVCNQAAASHALPFGWDPWASSGSRCAEGAGVTRPSERLRPASRA